MLDLDLQTEYLDLALLDLLQVCWYWWWILLFCHVVQLSFSLYSRNSTFLQLWTRALDSVVLLILWVRCCSAKLLCNLLCKWRHFLRTPDSSHQCCPQYSNRVLNLDADVDVWSLVFAVQDNHSYLGDSSRSHHLMVCNLLLTFLIYPFMWL